MLTQDLRFAVRTLRRDPGFTGAAIVTLALGIGANCAVFSLLYGTLLRPLPYANGERIVVLEQKAPAIGIQDLPFSIFEAEDLRERLQSLDALVEYHQMTFTLLGRDEPERVRTGVVSPEIFEVLGVDALHGRLLRPADNDPDADPTLVLSHEYWQRAFGGDSRVIGRTFELNDRAHTVVGVLPPVPQFPADNDVYMPIMACPFRAASLQSPNPTRNTFRMMTLFGRLRPESTLDNARAELAGLAIRFQNEYPQTYPADSGYALDAAPLADILTRKARPTLIALLLTAALILAIACANVALLNLARLERRGRELAIRAALGASRRRVLRQMVVESVLLATLGGTVGVLMAYGGLDLLKTFLGRFTTRADAVAIDGRVLVATALLTGLAALVFGVLPILGRGAASSHLLGALRSGSGQTAGRGAQRLRAALVIAQVAVSVLLLVGALAMLRSLERLWKVDPGFEPRGVVTAQLPLNWSRLATGPDRLAFLERVLAELATDPGIEDLGFANRPLLSPPEALRPGTTTQSFLIEGQSIDRDALQPIFDVRLVSPGYFDALGIPLVRGRLFDLRDRLDTPQAALVSESAARRHWGDADPIGQRISNNGGQSWATIVGVVGDVKMYDLRSGDGEQVYRCLPQLGGVAVFWNLFARTHGDPAPVMARIKEAIHRLAPEQPVSDLEMLTERYEAIIAPPKLMTELLLLFAAVALLITAAGISGTVAFTISRRTREIGIRLALGATPQRVVRSIVRGGLLWVVLGLLVGLPFVGVLERLLAELLFQTETTDPEILLAVAAAVLGLAGLAAWLPARRAAAVDPTIALRFE